MEGQNKNFGGLPAGFNKNTPLHNDQIKKLISNTPLVKMKIILYKFQTMCILAHIFQPIFLFPIVQDTFSHERSIHGDFDVFLRKF